MDTPAYQAAAQISPSWDIGSVQLLFMQMSLESGCSYVRYEHI